MNETSALSPSQLEVRGFIVEVYRWMIAGLALSAAAAGFMGSRPELIVALARNPVLFWGLIILELGAVFVLAGWAKRMSAMAAMGTFLGYAVLNGVTLSVVLLAYTGSSIAAAFLVTAGTFAVMCVYGYATKTDLTSMGNLCFMGLIGIVIASFVNFFLHSSTLNWATTYIGVLVFTGLTAYDSQKIKGLLDTAEEGSEEETVEAIIGALTLYLDFVNLFLDILRIMGNRRDRD